MNLIKDRKCKSRTCRSLFTPRRIALKIYPFCSSGCELDHAQATANTKPKEKVKKPKTAAKLKKELWAIFSLFIKLKHSHDGEYCSCYTCDRPVKIGTSNAHGGHCLPKSVYKNLYFDERAVKPQCYMCNVNHGGMHYDFCEKLKVELGIEAFEQMVRHGKDILKRGTDWYLEKIEYYTVEVKRLKELKNNSNIT